MRRGRATRSHFSHRLAVVAGDSAAAVKGLRSWLAGAPDRSVADGVVPVASRPKVAWLMTGQGAQSSGMTRALYESEPVFRAELDRCADLLAPELDQPLPAVLCPADGTGDRADVLHQTGYTQPALFAVEWSLAQLWRHWGVQPDVVLGHSVGELVAACVAGVLPLADGLRIVAARGRLMQALPPGGGMVAVSLPEGEVLPQLEDTGLVIAAVNSPVETVVAGPLDALEELRTRLAAQGVQAAALRVSHAFHSPLMTPMLSAFRAAAATLAPQVPHCTVVSNVTGEIAAADFGSADYWVGHVMAPVRFAAGVRTALAQGCTVVQEIGPHPVLLAAGRQCVDDDTDVRWVASLRRDRDDWRELSVAIAQLYVAGVELNWNAVTGGVPTRAVDLPTYPFQRQRHWTTVTPRRQLSGSAVADEHPLLGRSLSSPALADTVFETVLTQRSHPLLAEHRIYDQIVVPAAHHLVTLAAAVDDQPTALAEVVFPQPMLLGTTRDRITQVIVGPAGDGSESRIQLVSRDAGEPVWTTHVTGTAIAGEASGQPHETPAAIQERCAPDPDYVAWFYEKAWQDGLELDAGFRWQSQIWRCEGEALCRMRDITADDHHARYALHPGLVDASFQIVGAALPSADREFHVFVPLGVDRFRLHRTTDKAIWGHARVRPGTGSGQETITADVWLIDDDGEVIAEAQGLHLKRAEREALLRAGQPRTAGWLHEVHWRPEPLPAIVGGPGRWLVCAVQPDDGVALAQQLRAYGQEVVLAGPEEFDPTESVPLRGAVLLADAEPGPSDVEDVQVGLLRSALQMLQGLASAETGRAPKLYLVTRGACAAVDADEVAVAQTPLWGLGNVIELEHPELWGGHIDLDRTATGSAVARSLAAELLGPAVGDRVALRGAHRLIARLAPQSAVVPTDSAVTLRADGTYLITGGLGALGRNVAAWLVERGARHLILAGRREPSDEAEAILERLRESGATVTVVQADVAQQDDVDRLMAAVPPGRTLCGVIHLAGVLRDGVLLQQSWEDYTGVLAPKVDGGWNLHRATRDLPLDFFVLFSSAASLLGSSGQANYAAANAFLDGLAHYRRSRGLPAVSINWGPWTEAGMAAQSDHGGGRWAAHGIGGITPAQGLDLLEYVLRTDAVQVGVLPVSWSAYLRRFAAGTEPALLRDLARRRRTGPQGTVEHPLQQRLAAAPARARLDLLRRHVRDQVIAVLGLPPNGNLEPQQKFFELGLDSLMAIELKNTLQSQLGQSLPSTVVFEYPTVETLADYLAREVLALGDTAPPDSDSEPDPAGETLERLKVLSAEDLEHLLAQKLASLAERRKK